MGREPWPAAPRRFATDSDLGRLQGRWAGRSGCPQADPCRAHCPGPPGRCRRSAGPRASAYWHRAKSKFDRDDVASSARLGELHQCRSAGVSANRRDLQARWRHVHRLQRRDEWSSSPRSSSPARASCPRWSFSAVKRQPRSPQRRRRPFDADAIAADTWRIQSLLFRSRYFQFNLDKLGRIGKHVVDLTIRFTKAAVCGVSGDRTSKHGGSLRRLRRNCHRVAGVAEMPGRFGFLSWAAAALVSAVVGGLRFGARPERRRAQDRRVLGCPRGLARRIAAGVCRSNGRTRLAASSVLTSLTTGRGLRRGRSLRDWTPTWRSFRTKAIWRCWSRPAG